MNRTDFFLDDYGFSQETEFCEWCIGQAVQALIDDSKEEIAAMLLACRVSWEWENWSADGRKGIFLTLHGPMIAIKAIKQDIGFDPFNDIECTVCPNLDAILEVLQLVLGPKLFIERSGFQVESANLPANWREELLEIAQKKEPQIKGGLFQQKSLLCINTPI